MTTEPTEAVTMTRCPNNLIKTYLVSFPRSGHHLSVRGLQAAMNHQIVYSEFYRSKHNMDNCDCVNLQKSHDFDMALPIREDYNYIVLIRGFELAVESWYKLSAPEGIDLETFRDEKKEYFDKFMEKWVSSPNFDDSPNRLVVSYHDLVDKKIETVAAMARFMGADPDMLELTKWEHRERTKYSPSTGR